MKVLYERVAGIDVHKDMIKVAVRSPGRQAVDPQDRDPGVPDVLRVLQAMARQLRRRGVTHVVMEASGVYTEPVYYGLAEQEFAEIAVINPAHAKALKGHKTDAKDCARLGELFECGLLRGSYIPPVELKEVRDLTRYRHLCRCRHRCRYAEARIMPLPDRAAWVLAVAAVKASA
jgi:transposase